MVRVQSLILDLTVEKYNICTILVVDIFNYNNMKPLLPGNLEQEILSIIWSSDHWLPVREVLNQCKEKYAYTTVMTVMDRLTKKGLLTRRLCGRSFIYSYTQNKNTYAQNNLDHVYDSLMSTFGDLAISHFVDSVKKDKKNLKLLEEYLSKK